MTDRALHHFSALEQLVSHGDEPVAHCFDLPNLATHNPILHYHSRILN